MRPARVTTNTEGFVDREGSAWDHGDRLELAVTEPHDGSLTKALLNAAHDLANGFLLLYASLPTLTSCSLRGVGSAARVPARRSG